jgi:hypothetical protein
LPLQKSPAVCAPSETPYGSFTLKVDGNVVAEKAPISEAVKSVPRISFRTGEFRNLPARQTVNEKPRSPLPGADEAVEEAAFGVDEVVLVAE